MNTNRWILAAVLIATLGAATSCCCGKTSEADETIATSIPTIVSVDFKQQPEDQLARVGTPVVFSATAPAPPGLQHFYQWYRNGQAVPGATDADYRIASVSTNDAGYYNCLVTAVNPAGHLVNRRTFSELAELQVYDEGSVIVYGMPLVTSLSGSECPGNSAGYIYYRKPQSPYGWEVANPAIEARAEDPNRSDTRITFTGYTGSVTRGCGTNSVTIPPGGASKYYQFTIYFPRGTAVPQGPYLIRLVNFKM